MELGGISLNKIRDEELKIKKYHNHRVKDSLKNFDAGAKIILHLIPLNRKNIKPENIRKLAHSTLPFETLYLSKKTSPPLMLPNHDPNRYLRCGNNNNGKYATYLKLSNGCIEAIDAQLINGNDDIIPTTLLKDRLSQRIIEYSEVLKYLNFNLPIYIYLTLKDISGKKLPNSSGISKSTIKQDAITRMVIIDSSNLDRTIDNFLDSLIASLK